MTKEVEIGGQSIKLRATGSLPIAYRLMFNRDLLQDMDTWREKLRVKLETQDTAAEAETPNKFLYELDIVLLARLAYCMAKSAEPSIPDNMTAWLDTLEDPNALYMLSGTVIQLYNNGFETTVEAKKNIPPQPAP